MKGKLSYKGLYIILVFALFLFQIQLEGIQSVSGANNEGKFIPYKLNRFEFQSINQDFPLFPTRKQ
ncbi:MAG: hypothetical protein HeimC2_45290 [Candidatus Heimdallarchaeota archaeon LC_2]|nr:MAG: hypothetical protein HeimC2_45290 [Candidatus Heimdallarchaeota archaeon LC_2]